MILKGKLVTLRPIEFEDLDMMRNLINDPDLEANIVGWLLPISKKDQDNWYSNFKNNQNNIRFIIEYEQKAVGFTGITDIDWKNGTAKSNGIRLTKSSQGKGLATDVYMTMLNYVFNELRLHRFSGSALENNMASIRLMEKCGYRHEGIIRDAVFKMGKYQNVVIMGVLKNDFEVAYEKYVSIG